MTDNLPTVMQLPDWFTRIHFAFSRRGDGQMSFKRASGAIVARNRDRFLRTQGMSLEQVAAGELIHSAQVAVVGSEEAGRGAYTQDWIPGVDGLVTASPEVLLLTTHADCAPIVVYDPVHEVVGQAHAGWRGLRAGIVVRLVQAIRSFNGTGPNRLRAWIGPTVRVCCYPVGPEVAGQFPPDCITLVGGQQRLDLVRFIRQEFARLGFEPEAVSDSGICTSCSPEFSSFRRDGTDTQAMALVTGLRGV